MELELMLGSRVRQSLLPREHSLPGLLHAFRDLVPLKTPWLGELANSPSRGSISDYSSVDTALCRAKDGDGDLKH